MPKIHPTLSQEKAINIKKQALEMYKNGMGLRAIGKELKRSHEWIRRAIIDLSEITGKL